MRITQARFSVPFCILDEPMPSKALKLLVYLLSISDFGGCCRPGYEAMRKVMRDHSRGNGSDTTVRKQLLWLKKDGWIFEIRRTNARMLVWLQIPPRFRPQKLPKTTISVVHG